MKIRLISVSALLLWCVSLSASNAWAEPPYVEPPDEWIYDSGEVDLAQSIGVDRSGISIGVTSDVGNGSIVIYRRTRRGIVEEVIPFDYGNVHPTNEELLLPMTLVSQGFSAITVDSGRSYVYATGETFNGTDYDCLIKKYSSRNATEIWSRTYDLFAVNLGINGHDFCNDIALDDEGNIIIAGAKAPLSGGNYYSSLLAKFDSDGNYLMDNGVGPENCGPVLPCQAQINKIDIDDNGQVYALAKSWMTYIWIAAWDSDLNKVPVGVSYPMATTSFVPEDIAVDEAGNLYAVGYDSIYNDSGVAEMHHKLVRFDSSFNETCEDHQLFGSYSYYHDNYDRWYGVLVDSNSHAYVTGSDQGDLIALEYDTTCTPQWTDGSDQISPLFYDSGGFEIGYDVTLLTDYLYITGAIWSGDVSDDPWDALTLKYTPN